MSEVAQNVLEIRNLRVSFSTEEGEVPAVSDVSLAIPRGKVTAVVGESGCGKSVTGYSIMRLIQKPGRIGGGEIILHPSGGEPFDILALGPNSAELYDLRGGKISMIFQEPMTALSPVHTVGNQICEAIRTHRAMSGREAEALAVEFLGKVGIPGPRERLQQYPFEMSGGMRQRVVIAMALVCGPELLIADEPTTALDVTIQAQVIALMKSLQRDTGTSVLLITHDLGVVAQMADEVAVMYLGRIIERGGVTTIMKGARHPYTQGLIASLPSLNMGRAELPSIRGSVPPLTELPPGCPFHPRCPHFKPGFCDTGSPPPMRRLAEDHAVACLLAEEVWEGAKAQAGPERKETDGGD